MRIILDLPVNTTVMQLQIALAILQLKIDMSAGDQQWPFDTYSVTTDKSADFVFEAVCTRIGISTQDGKNLWERITAIGSKEC